ncbi:Imm30 family immunity protein [Psychrobacillus sp. NPDC093180]|uniref:Imm30 family immunity protein n=1 Tax=Psychrobacillus sp. NPDC093180 TaxID=3364489 RepID=UPI00382572BA
MYTNRLLQSPTEVSEFEKALANLINFGNKSIITELCMVFDDDTERYEVMFGLVHGIEHLYKESIEEGVYLIALAVPSIIDRAREWMEELHYRILNHEQVRSIYANGLTKVDLKTKGIIINLLMDIKKEDPNMFGNSVDEILKGIELKLGY